MGGGPTTQTTRVALPKPDLTRFLHPDCCPECQGKLVPTGELRSRQSEDIPESLEPVIAEDLIHRDYCPNYKNRFEPRVPDVLPEATLCYLRQEELEEAKFNVDETGWRVQGSTNWLWCFTGPNMVYYMIDDCRGSPALQNFFTLYFEGTLITDF